MDSNKQEKQYTLMTKTPIPKLIVKLAIPTTISMLITNVYNLVDTAFVGKLGTSASGAVGIVFGFMMILQAVAFLFGQGSGAIMSRNLGKNDVKKASSIASLGFFSALAGSIIAAIICLFIIDPLVVILGSTPTIAPFAKTYTIFILISAPAIVCSFVMNNLLRYEGKAMLGMIGLSIGAVLNIAGDALFMFVFNMGIAGAGLSTCISQFISFGILLSFFLRGKTICRLSIYNAAFNMSDFGDVFATGFPSLVRQGLQSLSTIVLNFFAGPYGDAAIAAMSIVSRIVFFVFSVVLGIAQGFQPVSAFNYGAKKYDRIREAFKFSILLSEVFIVVFSLIVIIFSGNIIYRFRDDAEVVRIGTRALRLQCISQIVTPFCTMTEMQLQSTGKKLLASITSFLKSGAIFIPALFILANTRGLSGIQEAQPLATVVVVIPLIFFAKWFFKNLPKGDL
ncbi:MAG: MATE family efflux transporter [Clostridia bacterium]|nr:MATE family efflux transporter [Clostridia bacterium]